MIVNLESEEATVVELKLSDHAIQRWLQDPKDNAEEKKITQKKRRGENQSRHHRHDADD